jgi:hypothetical protein
MSDWRWDLSKMIFTIIICLIIFSVAADAMGSRNSIFYLISFFLSFLVLLLIYFFARDSEFLVILALTGVLINMLASGWKFYFCKSGQVTDTPSSSHPSE